MTHNDVHEEQDQNTAKLVMNTFYKVNNENGTTAEEIARYLQDKFGEVWRVNALISKAEETLKRSAAMGFLERHGDKYIAKLTRGMGCRRRVRRHRRRIRRRRSCRRRPRRRRSCRRRPRRRSCRRRSRTKPSCSCG